MEQKLIDANALEERFSWNCAGECGCCSYNNSLCDIITEAPAVDAIPRERIEQIKAELTKDYVNDNPKNFTYTTVKLKEVLYIIDKYTKEQNNE